MHSLQNQEPVLPAFIREPNGQCRLSTKSKPAFLSVLISASSALEAGHYFLGNCIHRWRYKSCISILSHIRYKKKSQIQDTEISRLYIHITGKILLQKETKLACKHSCHTWPDYILWIRPHTKPNHASWIFILFHFQRSACSFWEAILSYKYEHSSKPADNMTGRESVPRTVSDRWKWLKSQNQLNWPPNTSNPEANFSFQWFSSTEGTLSHCGRPEESSQRRWR